MCLMSSYKWRCYELLSMLCLVKGDFLGTLGGSSIMEYFLYISLVWLGGCLRWWSLCEFDVYDVFKTFEYMWLCLWSKSMKCYCKVTSRWYIVLNTLEGCLRKVVDVERRSNVLYVMNVPQKVISVFICYYE